MNATQIVQAAAHLRARIGLQPRIAVVLGLAWVLAINSNRAWTATDDDRATPWAEMIVKDS